MKSEVLKKTLEQEVINRTIIIIIIIIISTNVTLEVQESSCL